MRKLADGEGLALVIMPTGARYWRLKYRHGGSERSYSIGTFPTVGLAEARAERARAKEWLRAGLDPTAQRRIDKATAGTRQAATFSAVAEEWYEAKRKSWKPRYAANQRKRLDRDLLPSLGALPIADIDAPAVLKTLRKLEARKAYDQLVKCRVMVGMVCRFANATGRPCANPVPDIKGAFVMPPVVHRATLATAEFPKLFKSLGKVPAEPSTKLALYWLIATAARAGEARFATCDEIEHGKLWRIPAERMKRVGCESREHVVPVSALMHDILQCARDVRVSDDDDALIFPGFTRHGALSENALLALLASAGYFGKQTPHGFRGAFSTWAHETANANPDVIEGCLAHKHKQGSVRFAYNHARYVAQRRKLLDRWGAFLVQQGLHLP